MVLKREFFVKILKKVKVIMLSQKEESGLLGSKLWPATRSGSFNPFHGLKATQIDGIHDLKCLFNQSTIKA